jgi:hypothetical protein
MPVALGELRAAAWSSRSLVAVIVLYRIEFDSRSSSVARARLAASSVEFEVPG